MHGAAGPHELTRGERRPFDARVADVDEHRHPHAPHADVSGHDALPLAAFRLDEQRAVGIDSERSAEQAARGLVEAHGAAA